VEAGAVSELQGIARYKFHEGKLEEFKRLSAQCMDIVRTKDTGTLQYDIYFNDDQSECIVLERYRDSEALIEHLANLGDIGEAILATGSVSGELLGEPSAELRANLAGSPVRLFTPFLSSRQKAQPAAKAYHRTTVYLTDEQRHWLRRAAAKAQL
jgi:quinol monooxygenase YgiN